MVINTWGQVLTQSLQSLWFSIITYIPNIIVAIIIFIAGWVTGVVIGGLVARLVHTLHIDRVLEGAGLKDLVSRAGYRLNSGAVVGGIVKWFIILVFLIAALDALQLSQVNEFLRQVLGYLPSIIVAVLIVILAAFIADFVGKLISGSARAAGSSVAQLAGRVARWAIWAFAVIAALTELGIAENLFQALFIGFVAMLALAGGLAFGLGGRDMAARWLARAQEKIDQK